MPPLYELYTPLRMRLNVEAVSFRSASLTAKAAFEKGDARRHSLANAPGGPGRICMPGPLVQGSWERCRSAAGIACRPAGACSLRAAVWVWAGGVLRGAGSRRAAKPGELVDPKESLSVAERPAYVSRGGVKLA